MELVSKRAARRKKGSDCLLENMEISDHMIGESVRAHRSHGHHASAIHFEYRRLYNAIALVLGDIFSLTAVFLITGSLRAYFLGEPFFQWWGELILPIWLLGAFAARLYPGWGLGAVEELKRQTVTLFAVFSFSAVLLFWFQLGTDTSRFALTFSFVLSLFVVPAIRRVVKSLLIQSGQYGLPVVIYGAGSNGRDLVDHLENEKGLGYQPIAFLDDHPSYWGANIKGIPVLGDTNLVLPEAQIAILAINNVDPEYRRFLLEGPLSYYRNVILIPDMQDLPTLWVGTIDMGGTLGLKISLNLADPLSRLLKRSFDLAATTLTSMFWVPLVGLIAGLIWMQDRQNPFFLQKRIGQKGTEFQTWKFRTMMPDAEAVLQKALAEDPALKEEWERDFKLKNDPRINRLGHLLRKYSLDEIPQLFNVLKGQMSLVGPRPLPAYHSEELDTRIQSMRMRVSPGMTGMWQVSGRSDVGTNGMEQYDSYYIRNWSIWLDIVILVRTLSAVTRSSGAY
ncbi:MAG: undecaprenyl-phosphate galactose phosphotransferase WbaP [Bacteroidetes Order II. Incertae sedis bacterium]|nr:undecaprenyl-phosphate galactose phosphotransferase WbaP [Bacteroidetes Order II. bacterium]